MMDNAMNVTEDWPVSVDFNLTPDADDCIMYDPTSWELFRDGGTELRGTLCIESADAIRMAGHDTSRTDGGDTIVLPLIVTLDNQSESRALTIELSAHTAALLVEVLTKALVLHPCDPA